MKKKLTALGLVLAVVASLFAGMTLTYFTDKDTVTNAFTVGDIDIKVYEHPLNADGKTLNTGAEPVQSNTYTNIVPGVTYGKDPTIKNIGSNGAYARMLVTLPKDLVDAVGSPSVASMFGGLNVGTEDAKFTLAGTDTTDSSKVTYIYTYNSVLDSNTSATLFTSFTLPATLKQTNLTALSGSFNITVTGQAIQADGFANAAAAFSALDAEFNS